MSAKICYPEHIKHIHGVIGKDGKLVYKWYKATDKGYLANRPVITKSPTPAMAAQRTKFATAAAQVATIMADPQQLASYKVAFDKQSKYATLRGYVFAQVLSTL